MIADRERYVNLATFRRDGRRVATPVWFARPAAAGPAYVFSAGDAGKVKRLRNSDRAEVAPCDVRGGLRGPWLPARAWLVDDAAECADAYAALRAKYGWQMWLTDLASRLTGRIRQRQVLAFTETAGDAA